MINLLNLGDLALRRGEPARAAALLAEGLEQAREIGFRDIEPFYLVAWSHVELERGETERARDLCLDALALLAPLPDRPEVAACLVALGQVELKREDASAAIEAFAKALELSTGSTTCRGGTRRWRAWPKGGSRRAARPTRRRSWRGWSARTTLTPISGHASNPCSGAPAPPPRPPRRAARSSISSRRCWSDSPPRRSTPDPAIGWRTTRREVGCAWADGRGDGR